MPHVTMAHVAEAAGVSRALVSLAYRDAPGVNRETRDRILKVGESLGYRHNRIAAALASKSPSVIGVYLLDLHNDVFADIFDGIRDELDKAGKHVVLAVGSVDGSRDKAALDTLQQSRVNAIIGAAMLLKDSDVRKVHATTPIISASRFIRGIDSVFADDEEGSRLAVEHLLGLGHRRIAFLANPPLDAYRGRRAGFEAAMAHAGLAPRLISSEYSREAAARDALQLLDSAERPTAIFAHNDQAAFGVLDAASLRGLRVPEDLSIVGFDDSTSSSAPGTALTTIGVHGVNIGRLAAQTALLRLSDPTGTTVRTTIDPHLVVRSTTGPAPA